ncbi:response regulator [Roseospira goensis]|uniref:Sensory/regulatory protein RpfC n=1 Tax=Roseospira goensis TaxID=391922 RepID=A0A7W6WLU1_9PROT|nr:response regulator [Roseospira goensis]MBB4287415.1 PAS domain S-box-containing protein [Roseospira goensis]
MTDSRAGTALAAPPRLDGAGWRAILEHSPFGIALVDADGRTLFVNQRLADMLGRDRDSLQSVRLPDLYPDLPQAARMRELIAGHAHGGEHEVRLGVRTPGGQTEDRWFQVWCQAVRIDGRDAVTCWHQDVTHRHMEPTDLEDLHAELQVRIAERTRAMGVEITESRYAEAALREANDFLERKVEERTRHLRREVDQRRRAEHEREQTEMELLELIEKAPIAVGIADRDGRFLFWNPPFFRLGRQRMEDTGKIAFGLAFTDPELMPALQARVNAGEAVENVEAHLLTGDDDPRWVLVSMRGLAFEGQPALLTWVFDITDMKAQAEALEEARQAAEASARAKSAFLATMSHEIRTPMNGVITMAEMLGQTDLDADQRHMLGVVTESANALLSIIDEILDFSKIEAGRVTLDEVPLSLEQITERVADLLGPKADQKGLDLLCRVDPRLPDRHRGDLNRLRQILVNLVGNAIKFTERGHVTIAVDPCAGDDRPQTDGPAAPRLVRLSVADTGIGLTDAQINGLFQPFSQADSSTQRRFGGTGLGLSICRTLADLMGGRIGVDSTPGQGSTFWIEVPLTPDPAAEDRPAPDLTGARVLVVGDSTPSRHRLADILATFGATVATAADGDALRSALMQSLVSERPFHAVILDRRLDGQAAIHHLDAVLRIGASAPPRVLIVASRGRLETRQYADRAGVAGVIGWPLHRAETGTLVSIALGRTTPAASAAGARDAAGPSEGGARGYVAPAREAAMAAGCLVLVAEDNPTNQTVIRILLDRLGLVADIAGNGVEALARFRAQPYGLVVTDCHMPEMDGYELAGRIRAVEAEEATGRHTPIIALTADAITGTAQLCLDRGMDDYLTKPVALSDLDAAIRRWLPRAAALRRPREAADTPAPAPTLAHTPAPTPAPVGDDPAAAADDEPILDLRPIGELVGGDRDMMRQLLADFVAVTETDVSATLSALDRGDLDGALKAAHSAAGAARSAGAMRLGTLCKRIEIAAMKGDADTPARLKGDLLPAFIAVAAAVRAL